MSAVEISSHSEGGSSTSAPSPPGWLFDLLRKKKEGTTALRQAICGMEAQLVDLVVQNLSPERLMDWLRVPLECAAAAGNFDAVKRLLAAGVKTQAPSKRSPLLHLAAKSGNAGVVEELLKAGVNVRERDSSRGNQTALHYAAAAGSDAAVRALTRAGAIIDLLDGKGWSPLHHACKNGHRGVVVFLLLKGARAQRGWGDTSPPLHLAAINNHPGVIEDLLYFGKAWVGGRDTEGQTALHVAAQHRRVEACVALLRGGATVGSGRPHGMTCLDVAASNGNTGKVLQILTSAEETHVRKRSCSLALYHAVEADQPDTIRDLVALGADVKYLRPDNNATSLHVAVSHGAVRAAEALLEAGVDVHATFIGDTPLHVACWLSSIDTVQLLLCWGADEDARDVYGQVPSEVVGIREPDPDEDPVEELLPEEMASRKSREDRIRSVLETAPADRRWRRRGWLVLCRARWLARVDKREKHFVAPLGYIPNCATGSKKRRGIMSGSALAVKPRDLSLSKGKAHRRTEGGGECTPEATAAAEMLRLGTCSVLSDGGAGLMAGVAGLDGRTRFVVAVEQLLLSREDSIFREVVAYL